ncbi:glutathione S-transferase 1-like isoform X2 [Paramacrobiotus metropolitanus]|uniref:glutathione S-transferase 1-like isoform X2 n=1 Tax=Paramacrobiotus metropolitanus TaxID=2943436 RepID=UPI002446110F|nr:glutathione S-transferase 1-like isoform X2 [Paramacrobiotus metropolitanus]
MDSRFKLYYFDARARGELIRLIFHAAGEDFEDIKVYQGMWEKLKPAMPFHTLPVLEIGEQQLSQSLSIARYLANIFDMAGRNNLEKALVDSAAELIDELLSDALKIIYEREHKYKARATKKFGAITLPAKMHRLEEFHSKYGKGYGYIVGNDLTYADLAAYSTFIVAAAIVPWEYFEQFPYPSQLKKRILDGEPRLSQYFRYTNS